jgi:hypothetical protein
MAGKWKLEQRKPWKEEWAGPFQKEIVDPPFLG